MRIGIDGGCWSVRRGYGRFLRELLEALERVGGGHEYLVFLDSASHRDFHLPEPFRPILVETGQAVTAGASADGSRALMDLLRMSRAVAREKMDLFFFSSVYSYFPLLNRVPTLLGIHDTIADTNPQFSFGSWRQRVLWKVKVRMALAQADRVLTVSEYSKRCIQKVHGLAVEKISVISEAASAKFRHTGGAKPAVPYVLYVGGLSPNKNLPAVVRAYEMLRSRAGGLQLLLVGDYESDSFKSNYAELKALARELGIEREVTFTGYVPDDDLIRIYNQASVFVMPSFDEGFGLPAIEAMACGAPVVVSRGNSLEEVVGDAGIAVAASDHRALADAMDAILSDAKYASELSSRSLRRAAEFSWDAAALALLRVFEKTAR